jgi:hypothetical protein
LENRERNEDGVVETFDDLICEAAGLPAEASYAERKIEIDACPAEMQSYCSYEWPMFLLCVRGAEYLVHRGYTEEITAKSLAVKPEKIAAFKAFCEANSIPWQEPKWLLCSMYG